VTFTPRAPRVLDAPVAETYWKLFLPAGYEASRSDGNMKEVLGSVLYGGRVKAIVSELERQTKIAEATGQSLNVKVQALRNKLRLRQELDDNVVLLDSAGTETGDFLRRNKSEDVQSQQQFNSDNRRAATNWQERIGMNPEQLEAAIKRETEAEQMRLLLDNFYFLENRWRFGQAGREGLRPTAAAGINVDDLRFILRPAGFKKGELPAQLGPENEELNEKPVKQMLVEKRDEIYGAQGGRVDFKRIEDAAARDLGMTVMTFIRSVEGQPELELKLRSTRETARYGSLLVLSVIALAAWLVYRRRHRKY